MAIFQILSTGDYAKLSFHLMPYRHILSLEPALFPLDNFVEEVGQNSSTVLKESCEQIEERNKKIKENVASQLEAQSVLEYQTKLLSAMDLEKN